MPLEPSHPDYWTEALQFTEHVHRDVYPAIDPSLDKIRTIAKGKVVLVTGAGSGFGEGACRQWAKAGAEAIVLAARCRDRIDAVAQSLSVIAPATKTLAIATDVVSETQVEELFSQAVEGFGHVDVVVHAAGVLGPISSLSEATVDSWWQSFEINAKGTFLVARALAKASKGQEATLIHTGTAASYFASPGQSSYTSSKAASNMIVEQLNLEYPNLRVFNVHPGMAKSSVLRQELEIYAKDTPELFGSFTVYLAGPQADFLRGRFVAANWDVEDMERHQAEIASQGLLKGQAFKGDIGPGGHRFDKSY
ncbi:Fc.00g049530.m01.CDS01 [Cosmosporella sp. VM-42]